MLRSRKHVEEGCYSITTIKIQKSILLKILLNVTTITLKCVGHMTLH